MRRVGVSDFGNVTETGFSQMIEQRLQIGAARLPLGSRGVAVNPRPGINIRAEEPRPHSALMIGAVALMHSECITRCVAGFAWRKRAQTQRSPEVILHRLDNEEG